MMTKQPMLHLALAQLDIYLGEPAINLDTARTLVATAAARGANLIVLPELWSTGYDLGRAAALADVPGEGMYADLAALAREQGIAIIGSTLAHHPDRPTNHATCYDATGQLLASYDKIHLFGLMHEDAYLQAGTRQGLFDAPWGRSALAICYDLRFPELFRSYAVQGAAIIFVPAEWPTPRIEHWRTLVRARAIENQCFMVAVNRVGRDHTNQFGGHSLVVDPWGTVLVEGDDTAALLFAQLDLATVEEVRSQMTTLRDRRPDLY